VWKTGLKKETGVEVMGGAEGEGVTEDVVEMDKKKVTLFGDDWEERYGDEGVRTRRTLNGVYGDLVFNR
jgi:hypothetical protein